MYLLSDTLRNLGFMRADQLGRTIVDSQCESDRGTFLTGYLLWIPQTVAVDQAGWGWIAHEIIDLTPYGFRNILQDPLESETSFKPPWQ